VKPIPEFIAERPVAHHAALLGRGAIAQANTDPAEALARFCERLALALPALLGAMGGEAEPQVVAGTPREGVMRELLSRGGGLCSHGLLAEPGEDMRLLVSLDAPGLLQMVDLAFGGEGRPAEPLPERLPLSAQIVATRLEAGIAGLVARTAGFATGEEPAFAPLRNDADIAALRPFIADCPLWQIAFDVTFPGCEAWSLRLTLAASQLAALCRDEDEHAPAASLTPPADPANPAGKPFGDVPLTLTATLVDMRVPLARVATLRPGDVLPVSVARLVPLSIGAATIAHASIGELDDRVALQITQAFATEETGNPS
jgi:flagellar motor switch protein FliM